MAVSCNGKSNASDAYAQKISVHSLFPAWRYNDTEMAPPKLDIIYCRSLQYGPSLPQKVFEPNKQEKASSKEKIFLRLKITKPIKAVQHAKCLSGGLTTWLEYVFSAPNLLMSLPGDLDEQEMENQVYCLKLAYFIHIRHF